MTKLQKQPIFYTKKAQIISVFFINMFIILLMYNESYFNANDLEFVVPLLQEFMMFSLKACLVNSLLRGIEHQINLILEL